MTRHDKIQLFRSVFSGLSHAYGTYDPSTGRAWQVKQPVTEAVVLEHLTGKKPYGVYLLDGAKTRACVADFDREDLTPPTDFVAQAKHYEVPAYIERSKSKGYHAWTFFPETGVPARKARMVFRHILEEIDQPHTEVFPKQDALEPGLSNYGNFVNAPLFAALVPQGRTVFLNPGNGFQPYPNQWVFLESIVRVSETLLDDIIEVNELTEANASTEHDTVSLGVFTAPQALPPCARRMLEEGVTARQRVACFRLAVQLRRAGLPFDLVVAALAEWARKNRPEGGRRRITPWEVKAQTAAAFLKEYRGAGCEDPAVAPFCENSCALYGRTDEARHAGGPSPPLVTGG